MYHSLFICENLAEKMSQPEFVQETIDEAIKTGQFSSDSWQKLSFAEGMPGIACFYSAMHQAFPEAHWDKIADRYIECSLEELKKRENANCSLFTGLSGLSLAVYCASNNSLNYQNLLSKLDNWLMEEVRRSFLDEASKYSDETKQIPANFYNFAEGLSGILTYLAIRKESPYLRQLATECVNTLTHVLQSKKLLGSCIVPAWYLPQEHLTLEENQQLYPKGGFSSNMPFGLVGCLAALSLAAIEGLRSPNLNETILYIASWLKDKYSYVLRASYWNSTIPLEDEVYQLPAQYDVLQYSWLAGWPPIARSLYLAGRALNDASLLRFAENIIFSFVKNDQPLNFPGSSFYSGIAGFIVTTYAMAKDTGKPILFKTVNSLESELKTYYNPDFLFGFQQLSYDRKGNFTWINDPGFIYGSAGIGLALLSINERLKFPLFF